MSLQLFEPVQDQLELSETDMVSATTLGRAADDLAERDYITRKDRHALIDAAQDEPLYAP